MLREYLISVAKLNDEKKKTALNKLEDTFENYSRDMGARDWTREDLYD
jgi:hypothetical protein